MTNKMAELTREEMMDKMMEMCRLMMENMDEERKERKEHHKSMMGKLDNVNNIIDDIRNDSKRWREELRNERTKERKNDSKPETEEIPNGKTKEQVVVLPEIKTNGFKKNIKQREMNSKKMRRTYPRNLIKTKEELEMMKHGLIDVNNIPITNNKKS